jgi:hypothetical protein
MPPHSTKGALTRSGPELRSANVINHRQFGPSYWDERWSAALRHTCPIGFVLATEVILKASPNGRTGARLGSRRQGE